MTLMGHSKLYHTPISSLKTISSNNVSLKVICCGGKKRLTHNGIQARAQSMNKTK